MGTRGKRKNSDSTTQKSGIVTEHTVREIQQALHDSWLFNQRSDIMVPNVSWGLLPYEADFVSINRSGYLTEVEIKRSFEDFKKDFSKKHNHDDERVYYFYYCVPEAIYDKIIAYLDEKYEGKRNYEKPAVLYYDENLGIHDAGYGFKDAMHKDGVRYRKLFLEEQLTVARLGTLRYWKQENSKKEEK
jgi:hypothetical protein